MRLARLLWHLLLRVGYYCGVVLASLSLVVLVPITALASLLAKPIERFLQAERLRPIARLSTAATETAQAVTFYLSGMAVDLLWRLRRPVFLLFRQLAFVAIAVAVFSFFAVAEG